MPARANHVPRDEAQMDAIRRSVLGGAGSAGPQIYRASDYGMPYMPNAEAERNPYLQQNDNTFRQQILASRRNIGVPPRFVTATELRAEAREKTLAIFADFETLRAILDRHEATIQKRWLKKTKAQRLKILLPAWPGTMPLKHRPDMDAANKGTAGGNRTDWPKEMQDAFMWPNINQEDLTKTRVLPLLLNARGRNGPWVFWEFDIDSGEFSCIVGRI